MNHIPEPSPTLLSEVKLAYQAFLNIYWVCVELDLLVHEVDLRGGHVLHLLLHRVDVPLPLQGGVRRHVR